MKGNVHLKDLCLKKLDMGKTRVYMALASMLKDNSSLTSLNIACCQLDSGASEVLSPGLFNHPSLKHLDVSGNDLLNSQPSLHLVAPALAQNPVLHTLLLRDCDIPLSGLSTLQKGIQRNKVLKKVDMTGTGAALADSWMQLGVVDPRVQLDIATMDRTTVKHPSSPPEKENATSTSRTRSGRRAIGPVRGPGMPSSGGHVQRNHSNGPNPPRQKALAHRDGTVQ
eukprot:gene4655-14851_t